MTQRKESNAEAHGRMIREHAVAISVGGVVTVAVVGATIAWHERQQRREKLVEKYLSRQDVFQFSETEPDQIALMLRNITGASLLYPYGVTLRELEKKTGKIAHPRMFAVGDGVRLLLKEEMLEQFVETRDPRNSKFRPHEQLVRAILEEPDEWRQLEAAAQQYDEYFWLESLANTYYFSKPPS
ncbi:MAG: hypothetical protein WC498_01135 [Candidatus Saccharimonadales bacterium]